MEDEKKPQYSINEIISNNIKQLRELFKMTMKDVAEALGVKPNTYRVWENINGKNGVKNYYLVQLANIFGVKVDFLLTPHSDEDFQEIALHRLSSSRPNDLDAVYGDRYFTELGDHEKIFVMQMRRLSSADRKKVNEFMGSLLDKMDKLNNADE